MVSCCPCCLYPASKSVAFLLHNDDVPCAVSWLATSVLSKGHSVTSAPIEVPWLENFGVWLTGAEPLFQHVWSREQEKRHSGMFQHWITGDSGVFNRKKFENHAVLSKAQEVGIFRSQLEVDFNFSPMVMLLSLRFGPSYRRLFNMERDIQKEASKKLSLQRYIPTHSVAILLLAEQELWWLEEIVPNYYAENGLFPATSPGISATKCWCSFQPLYLRLICCSAILTFVVARKRKMEIYNHLRIRHNGFTVLNA